MTAINNKGFTLVELIATIAIICLSAGIIVMNMQGLESKNTNKMAINNISKIEEAACFLIDSLSFEDVLDEVTNKYPQMVVGLASRDECKKRNSGYCKMPLEFLISQGFIDEEEYFIENTKYKTIKKDMAVEIKWDANGFKTCTVLSAGKKAICEYNPKAGGC